VGRMEELSATLEFPIKLLLEAYTILELYARDELYAATEESGGRLEEAGISLLELCQV
jgi:hypothetical protein